MTKNKYILAGLAFLIGLLTLGNYLGKQVKESETKLTSHLLNGGSWTCIDIGDGGDGIEIIYKLSPSLLGKNSSIDSVYHKPAAFQPPFERHPATWRIDYKRLELTDHKLEAKLSGTLKIIDESTMEWLMDKFVDRSGKEHKARVSTCIFKRDKSPIQATTGDNVINNNIGAYSQPSETVPVAVSPTESSNVTPLTAAPTNSATNPDICANPISDPDIRQCASEKFDKLDRELNQLYKSVMAKLTPDLQVRLKREQIAWIRKKEAECNAPDQYGEKGYPAWVLNSIGCQMTETQRRILELRAIEG